MYFQHVLLELRVTQKIWFGVRGWTFRYFSTICLNIWQTVQMIARMPVLKIALVPVKQWTTGKVVYNTDKSIIQVN